VNEKPAALPSAWYCLLAIPFFIGGISIFIYALIHGISHVTDSLVQVVVPGESPLELKQTKSYVVFLERQSVVNGKIYSTEESVNGLECNLVPVAGVQKIEMRPARVSTSYDVGGRSGRSIFEFHVPEDGTYKFACGYNRAQGGPEVVLAVGSGVGERLARTVIISLAGMFGGIASSVAVIIIVFILRARSKNKPAATFSSSAL
jgi:hypothetical protein